VKPSVPPPRRRHPATTNANNNTTITRNRKSSRNDNNRKKNIDQQPQQQQQQQQQLSRKKYNNAKTTKGQQQQSNKIRKRKEGANTKTTIHGTTSTSNTNTNTKQKQQKPKKTKTKKIYRRTKVLRTWVLPAFFLVPLGVILLEYYIGKLISLDDVKDVLDDVKDVYQEQLLDPWDLLMLDLNPNQRIAPPPKFLANVSYTPRTKCPEGQRRRFNVHDPMSHSVDSLIPLIVHQQSKTRCLTMKVDRATIKWVFRRVS